MKISKVLIILLFFTYSGLIAQFQNKTVISYENAHSLAFSGNYNEAIAVCDSLINKNNRDIDALILKSRILGWQNKYEQSRILLKEAQNIDSAYFDMFDAISDIEYWDNKFLTALYYVDSALVIYPDDSLFLAKKKLLTGIINEKADTITFTCNHTIQFRYYFDYFNEYYKRRWHVLGLGYPFTLKDSLQFFPKANLGYLSPTSGSNNNFALQLETDVYYIPHKNYYLYASLGVANNTLFPKFKVAFEYFSKYLFDTEISMGARYMKWNEDIYYITGSVSRYFDSYWLMFRPYFPIRNSQTTGAYMFTARKYFNNTEYAGISYVFGAAPDQSYDLFLEHGAFKSHKIVLQGKKNINERVTMSCDVSFSEEEYQLNRFQKRFDIYLGIDFCF